MNPVNRASEIQIDYENAINRLKEGLLESPEKSIHVDGAIQRFEFTFELAWKLMKAVLAQNGIEASSPRKAIKESFRAKLIQEGEAWIDMLEDRNKTTHIYDESEAKTIYTKIKEVHAKHLEELLSQVQNFK